MAADLEGDRCWFGGVAEESRGLATWRASLPRAQATALHDLLTRDARIDECYEDVVGDVTFPSGEVRRVCRFNIVARSHQDRSRIWIDYMLEGDTPDAPSEDVEAIALTEAVAADVARVLGLILDGLVDADQIAACAKAGVSADEWRTLSQNDDFIEGSNVLGGLRGSPIVSRDDWIQIATEGA